MKKEHLKKLEMPAKKAKGPSAEDMDMELGLEDEEGMDEMEMPLDELAPLPEENEALAGISDEELMAEIQKRGLMADLEEPLPEDSEEEEMDLGLEGEEEEDEYKI